jgi:putative membrane protein
VVWGWHAPLLHLAARHHPAIFVLEQGSMLVVSLWLWLAILGGPAASRPVRAAAGLIALVLTFSHMTMLGAVLTLSPRDLYGHGADGLADQQRAGAVMIAAATVTYLGAAVWLSRLLLSRAAAERRA